MGYVWWQSVCLVRPHLRSHGEPGHRERDLSLCREEIARPVALQARDAECRSRVVGGDAVLVRVLAGRALDVGLQSGNGATTEMGRGLEHGGHGGN